MGGRFHLQFTVIFTIGVIIEDFIERANPGILRAFPTSASGKQNP